MFPSVHLYAFLFTLTNILLEISIRITIIMYSTKYVMLIQESIILFYTFLYFDDLIY